MSANSSGLTTPDLLLYAGFYNRNLRKMPIPFLNMVGKILNEHVG
jgi:hypothetical protein